MPDLSDLPVEILTDIVGLFAHKPKSLVRLARINKTFNSVAERFLYRNIFCIPSKYMGSWIPDSRTSESRQSTECACQNGQPYRGKRPNASFTMDPGALEMALNARPSRWSLIKTLHVPLHLPISCGWSGQYSDYRLSNIAVAQILKQRAEIKNRDDHQGEDLGTVTVHVWNAREKRIPRSNRESFAISYTPEIEDEHFRKFVEYGDGQFLDQIWQGLTFLHQERDVLSFAPKSGVDHGVSAALREQLPLSGATIKHFSCAINTYFYAAGSRGRKGPFSEGPDGLESVHVLDQWPQSDDQHRQLLKDLSTYVDKQSKLQRACVVATEERHQCMEDSWSESAKFTFNQPGLHQLHVSLCFLFNSIKDLECTTTSLSPSITNLTLEMRVFPNDYVLPDSPHSTVVKTAVRQIISHLPKLMILHFRVKVSDDESFDEGDEDALMYPYYNDKDWIDSEAHDDLYGSLRGIANEAGICFGYRVTEGLDWR